jgi:2'-5' RNA ligase
LNGIFVVTELTGPALEAVHAAQQRFDPKLARGTPPHITLAGSSGVGPLPPNTKVAEIRAALGPAARAIEPFDVRFERPHRYMTTDIVVLPVDPHGAIRALHEAIAGCGLRFEPSRHRFSPHCTLSFYRRLTRQAERDLMAVRVDDPVRIGRLQFYLSLDLVLSRRVLELELGGG